MKEPKIVKSERVELPILASPFNAHNMDELMALFNLTITQRSRDKWHILYPNTGELDGFPQFGTVFIMATDGLLAYYHVDHSGQLFLGHLRAFNGPIAREYIHEDDWDYEKRKRKVNVFKRMDGTYAIIPKDHFFDRYWSKFPRMSHEEHSLYDQVGKSITIHELDAQLEKLLKTPAPTARFKSKRQQIIDSM